RTLAGEDRNARLENRGVVQRAGIDRISVRFADLAAEHEARTDCAEVADGNSAARGLRSGLANVAGNAHGAAGKPHEGNEPGARRLLAIGAVAKAGAVRFAAGFVAQRTAQAAAGVKFVALRDSS